MINECVLQVEEMRDRYQKVFSLVLDAKKDPGKRSKEELVDIAIHLRELSRLADDIRKECDKAVDTLGALACVMWTKDNINDPSAADPIRGEYATGTPDVEMQCSLPRPTTDPENFRLLMEHFGVTDDKALAVCRPHWPDVRDYVTRLSKEGKPLPPGVGKAYARHKMTLRWRKK